MCSFPQPASNGGSDVMQFSIPLGKSVTSFLNTTAGSGSTVKFVLTFQ
jgi:hypothetical protein